MGKIVLDTSIVVKWYLEEDDSQKALELLKKIKDTSVEVVIPNILLPELANALYFRGHLPKEAIIESLTEFYKLKVEIIFPSLSLLEEMTNLMVEFGLASYDALFLALAEELKIPLITADTKHHQKKFSKYIRYL